MGKWPGVENGQLNEGRDLAVTTDFRRVLGEAAYKSLGAKNMELVFPGAQVNQESFLNFMPGGAVDLQPRKVGTIS